MTGAASVAVTWWQCLSGSSRSRNVRQPEDVLMVVDTVLIQAEMHA